jgi:hypothetical protein
MKVYLRYGLLAVALSMVAVPSAADAAPFGGFLGWILRPIFVRFPGHLPNPFPGHPPGNFPPPGPGCWFRNCPSPN